MAERQPSKIDRKKGRQPISIPFAWEEKPGVPKKDWKATARPMKPAAVPVKQVVSVPFGWEEKPGTPLPSFVPSPIESKYSPPKEHNMNFKSLPRYTDHNDENRNAIHDGRDGSPDSEPDTTCSFVTNESFSSASSLLANGLISITELSNAVPVQQTSLVLTTTNSAPGSPASETDSSTSSYATGTTNLAGASFLEWLFPLLAPNSSFRGKVRDTDPYPTAYVQDKEFLKTTLISGLVDGRTSWKGTILVAVPL